MQYHIIDTRGSSLVLEHFPFLDLLSSIRVNTSINNIQVAFIGIILSFTLNFSSSEGSFAEFRTIFVASLGPRYLMPPIY